MLPRKNQQTLGKFTQNNRTQLNMLLSQLSQNELGKPNLKRQIIVVKMKKPETYLNNNFFKQYFRQALNKLSKSAPSPCPRSTVSFNPSGVASIKKQLARKKAAVTKKKSPKSSPKSSPKGKKPTPPKRKVSAKRKPKEKPMNSKKAGALAAIQAFYNSQK